jgi:hypothetical protein
MAYFDSPENSGTKEKIFNKANAGDCVCTLTVTKITSDEVGPKGNPLPANFRYRATFVDDRDADIRPIEYIFREVATDAKDGVKKAVSMSARWLFEALGGNLADVVTDDNDVNVEINNMLDYCVLQGSTSVRAFFHYGKSGKADAYLNWKDGYDRSVVAASDTTFEFAASSFMTRPPRPEEEETEANTSAAAGASSMF